MSLNIRGAIISVQIVLTIKEYIFNIKILLRYHTFEDRLVHNIRIKLNFKGF